MKKTNIYLVMILLFLGVTSCEKDEISSMEAPLQELEITKRVIEQVKALNYNPEGIKVITYNKAGATKQGFLVEGDVLLTPEHLKVTASEQATTKQYRSEFIATNNRTLSLFAYNSGSKALSSKMQAALVSAVYEYNNSICTGLKFNLTFGATYGSQSIEIEKLVGYGGGVAMMPSGNGEPGEWIGIYDYMEQYSQAKISQLFLHEMGHTVGLVHTDDPIAEYGDVHIPGTPTGADSNSVMMTAGGYNFVGLGYYDKVALETLYPLSPMTVNIKGLARGTNESINNYLGTVANSGGGFITYEWKYSYDGNYYNYYANTSSITIGMPYNDDLYLRLTVTSNCGSKTVYKHVINMDSGGGGPMY